jgi:hypothetical protein
MVFGVVLSEGEVMPSHIFDTGLRVNTDIYLEAMESTVLPWIKTVAGVRPWVMQQDSVPAMSPNRTIDWLKDHCYDLVSKDCWPPGSPDLNLLDCFGGATWRFILTNVPTLPRPP